MKTIHKFVLKSYLGPMIMTFFIVMFILVMQFMWRYIDELVGKGLDGSVIFELMVYAAATVIPMGLPLATLLAAIMTMGNLGENYELLAMKSAGMSLMKIMRPLTILIFFVSIASFFVANDLVPYSMRKMYSLIYDIRQQKQSIEFKDGIFFNGIENMSILVEKQDPKTKLLTGVQIYDTRENTGEMTITLADSGYISLSDDKKFLKVNLYNGETYETSRNRQWYEENELRHHIFAAQNGLIPLSGFDFERTDDSKFGGSQTKNIQQLTRGIDSLDRINSNMLIDSYGPLIMDYLFKTNADIAYDSMRVEALGKKSLNLYPQVNKLDTRAKAKLYKEAKEDLIKSKRFLTYDERSAKQSLNQLYSYKVEWHRKMSLPVSVMIFFLIGASLGAIIRKGGLGMPIVVSVLFFVVYYIISITGEKMAKEGTWESYIGMWISSFILIPLSIFLMTKATNDSNILNADWYRLQINKVKQFFKKHIKWQKKQS
ncbi:MAG: LptF/LptG family permease [Rikenellaceae bacterium]